MNTKLEANYKNLERVIEWIKNADSKASITLAFDAAAIALIVQKLSSVLSFIKSEIIADEFVAVAAIILFCAFIISFILSVYNAFRVLLPNIKPRSEHPLFFFKTIANFSLSDFQKKMANITGSEIIKTVSEQTHINSKIASLKFDYLDKSWKYLITSIVIGLALILVVFFLKLR